MMTTEVLALLEERPYRLDELAHLLGRPVCVTRGLLGRLRADRRVCRQRDGCWSIPAVVPQPDVEFAAALAAVRAGHDTIRAVAKAADTSWRRAREVLFTLVHQGLVVQHTRGHEVFFKPAEAEPRAPRPSAVPARRTRLVRGVEYDVVFSGRESLLGDVEGWPSSLLGASGLNGRHR